MWDPISQILLMVAEAVLVSALLVFLFSLRGVLGLSPLYIALGVFQHMQVLLALSVYVEILPGVLVSPGSAVLFTSNLFTLLMVYIREDADEARKLIYGLLGANIVLSLLSLLFGLHLQSPSLRNPYQLPPELFYQNPRLLFIGTLTFFVDAILIIVAYEAISRTLAVSLFLRVYLTMALVLIVDSIIFSMGAFSGQTSFLSFLISGAAAKLVAAFLYSAILTLYLRRFEGSGNAPSFERGLGDLFQVLTYRQKYEILRAEITRDPLTRVHNRGFFDEILPQELELAKTLQRPVTLLMIDVDHFKQINDRYGHPEGDRVLQVVATTLTGGLRAADVVCRYGGEEFAAILLDADLQRGAELADKLRRAVSEVCREEGLLRGESVVTVTAGVASFPSECETVEGLVKLADERLYQGKQSGRNCVVSVG